MNGREYVWGLTIYDKPKDFPHHYVVAMWRVDDDGLWFFPFAALCDSLDEAREQVPAGLICFPREPKDELEVIETWM